MNVDGKVVIITGASAGIGLAIARTLAGKGAKLVLAARSEDKLKAISEELSSAGTDNIAVRTDVSDPNDLENLVEASIEKFGRINVLINNAGIEFFRHLETADPGDILQTIETNFSGTVLLTRFVVPHMLKQKSGCIINMSSTAGKHCPPFGAVYGATKAAMIGFTQGLRGEYLKQGISSTVICPGFTKNGGVYDNIVAQTGKGTNLALGGTTTKAVTRAVMKAIEKGPPELIVNFPPVRPAMVLREIFPRLGEMLASAVPRSFTKRAAAAAKKEQQ